MNYSIEAKPTVYNGTKYRSKLEARWATFFDLLGWDYEYEPFKLGGWIPDFVINNQLLCEVKPTYSYGNNLSYMRSHFFPHSGEHTILLCTSLFPCKTEDEEGLDPSGIYLFDARTSHDGIRHYWRKTYFISDSDGYGLSYLVEEDDPSSPRWDVTWGSICPGGQFIEPKLRGKELFNPW